MGVFREPLVFFYLVFSLVVVESLETNMALVADAGAALLVIAAVPVRCAHHSAVPDFAEDGCAALGGAYLDKKSRVNYQLTL